jgi:hypothetical protein
MQNEKHAPTAILAAGAFLSYTRVVFAQSALLVHVTEYRVRGLAAGRDREFRVIMCGAWSPFETKDYFIPATVGRNVDSTNFFRQVVIPTRNLLRPLR